MSAMLDAIMNRHSTRSYDGREIEEEKKDALMKYLDEFRQGPFGNRVRFAYVDGTRSLKELGTGSMIRGAVLYLAGAVSRGEMAMEDFGYCMEAAVIKATEMGVLTCWLAGSLSRSAFAKRIGLEDGELIPAVTPLGYPGERETLIVRTMGIAFGNKKRKDFEKLFFDGTPGSVLSKDEAGIYFKVLEAVRTGPSASNLQPWRIVRDGADHDKYHLYQSENRLFNSSFGDVKIQNIDMGIALFHFKFAARECGIDCSIVRDDPSIDAGDLKYIASWIKK
jgi:nitroreductase